MLPFDSIEISYAAPAHARVPLPGNGPLSTSSDERSRVRWGTVYGWLTPGRHHQEMLRAAWRNSRSARGGTVVSAAAAPVPDNAKETQRLQPFNRARSALPPQLAACASASPPDAAARTTTRWS